MEINYTNSREDIIGFHMRHYTKTKSYKISNNIYLAFTIILTILLGAILLLLKLTKDSNITISTDIKVMVAFLIIFVILFILFREKYFNYIFNLRLKRVYSYEKASSYFSKTKLTISENYLNLFTDLDTKSYSWKSIHGIHLIGNYIFITTTAHDDILIPLDCFNSPEEINYFLNAILRPTSLQLKRSYPAVI